MGHAPNHLCRVVMVRKSAGDKTYRVRLYASSRIKGNRLMPPPPFDELIEQFREAHAKHKEWVPFIGVRCQDDVDREKYEVIGYANLWSNAARDLDRYAFTVLKSDVETEEFLVLRNLSERTARYLPPALLREVEPFAPLDDFARWMVVTWLYKASKPKPIGPSAIITEPFWDSVCALSHCPHLNQTAEPRAEEEGEWLIVSKAAINATLFSHDSESRGRQLDDDFVAKYMVRHSPKKWRVRVDTMPRAWRDKLITRVERSRRPRRRK